MAPWLCWALGCAYDSRAASLLPQVGGEISEQRQGRFAPPSSVPQICSSLYKAAYDPRVKGILLKVWCLELFSGWEEIDR
jgi:hypothetical protein